MEELLMEFRQFRAEVSARFDGIYVVLEGLRRDTRMVRAAINDMARTDVSAGEVEAVHQDIERVQSELMAVAVRLAIVERKLP
jgi:hypothetical protein